MTKTFSIAEQHILSLFKAGESFVFNKVDYIIEKSGKPMCSRGEPKTDIYVGAVNKNNEYIEFKISFKKENADFLENKTSAERAEQLFGKDWSRIIQTATSTLFDDFKNRPLIYKSKSNKVSAGSITLGWKFEILNKKCGFLSSEIKLDFNQVVDVCAGTNLPTDKRNSLVNGTIVKDSGIANYILFEKQSVSFLSAQDVIDSVIPIEHYVANHPKVYFACKALNYRSFEDKFDGNRPLAVYVNWFVRNNKLAHEIVFDTPLQQGGNLICSKLKKALLELSVSTTDDLDLYNVEDNSIIHDD